MKTKKKNWKGGLNQFLNQNFVNLKNNWRRKKTLIVSSHYNISDTPFDQRSPRPPEESVLKCHRQTERQRDIPMYIATLWLNRPIWPNQWKLSSLIFVYILFVTATLIHSVKTGKNGFGWRIKQIKCRGFLQPKNSLPVLTYIVFQRGPKNHLVFPFQNEGQLLLILYISIQDFLFVL